MSRLGRSSNSVTKTSLKRKNAGWGALPAWRRRSARRRRRISRLQCSVWPCTKRSAQFARCRVSFHAAFQKKAFSLFRRPTRAGLGRHSRQVAESSSGMSNWQNSIRGDGPITSKKRHDGKRAGRSRFTIPRKLKRLAPPLNPTEPNQPSRRTSITDLISPFTVGATSNLYCRRWKPSQPAVAGGGGGAERTRFLAALASGTGCPVSASSLMIGDTAKGGGWRTGRLLPFSSRGRRT